MTTVLRTRRPPIRTTRIMATTTPTVRLTRHRPIPVTTTAIPPRQFRARRISIHTIPDRQLVMSPSPCQLSCSI